MQNKTLKEMERRMVTSFLDTIVLVELKNSSHLSGYDAMDFVHKKFGFLVSPGTVYALLYSMERKGLLKGAWAQTKRTYTLTYKGTETIDAILESKDEIQMFMKTILAVDQTFSRLLSQ
ncbi:PadR family transcriptional regulator [Candidatus Bathyarchaeota archaeon]|nr:PadR family transcriptional regulator [Candidatus Bathyarchaeota archaeon]